MKVLELTAMHVARRFDAPPRAPLAMAGCLALLMLFKVASLPLL